MSTTPAVTAGLAPENGFRTFLQVLGNTLVAGVTTSFLWFALTFWIYAETRNVIATGVIGASYMLFISLFSMVFGTLVDRFPKKAVMVGATVAALSVFVLDTAFFFVIGEQHIADLGRPWFWIFAVVLLAGAVVEQLRGITLSTTVTLLVPEERRGNANGMVGTVQGIGMLITSVFSGLSVGFLGMGWTLVIGVSVLGLSLLHLLTLQIPEAEIEDPEPQSKLADFRGGWLAVIAVPGLLALVLFTTLNNLYGGVAMTVMDPYGIDMFGVQGWGIWFAVISTGFIAGGAFVAAKGVGSNPIRTILLVAVGIGAAGALSTIREWGWLYIVGVWVFMALIPAAEAAEQTVIQRVVPFRKQGRVFGFAMTFEAASGPLVALLIAPLAELVVIPHMSTPSGQQQWAWLLGTGEARGIALLLALGGAACALVALVALQTPQYRRLVAKFQTAEPQDEAPATEVDDVAEPAGDEAPEPVGALA